MLLKAHLFINKAASSIALPFWTLFFVGFFLSPTRDALSSYCTKIFVPIALFLALLHILHIRLIWKEMVLFFLPILYLLLSTGWSHTPSLALYLRVSQYALSFFAIFVFSWVCIKQHRKALQVLFPILIVSAAFNAIFSLGMYTWRFKDIPNARLYTTGLSTNPNSAGMLHGIIILFCLGLCITCKQYYQKIIFAVLMLPSVMALFFSGAKTPIIALALAGCTFIFLNMSRGPNALSIANRMANSRKLGNTMMTLLLSIFVLSASFAWQNHYASQGYKVTYSQTSLKARMGIWDTTFKQWQQNKVFGMGVAKKAKRIAYEYNGKTFSTSHSHNFILDTLRIGGLIGVFLLLCQIAWVLRIGYLNAKTSTISNFLFCWLLFGLTCMMTYGPQPLVKLREEWFTYWIPACLILAVHLCRKFPKSIGMQAH